MFSQTAEYALRAAVCMAQNIDQPMTTQQIAALTRVPQGYLSKVLQQLVKSGLVRAYRGLHGGYRLDREPAAVSILEVVNAVDPVKRILTCPLGLESHGEHLCPLHRKMDNALATIEDSLGSTTVAEVLAEQSQSTPLCPSPAGASPPCATG